MEIESGKNAGKTTQIVLLNDPSFVRWYLGEWANKPMGMAFKQHIAKLDAKPFLTKCHQCEKQAKKASAYQNNSSLLFWCDDCDPYWSGANGGKLTIVRSFTDVVDHIVYSAESNKKYMKEIVRSLAEAKGLPKRVNKDQAAAFFK